MKPGRSAAVEKWARKTACSTKAPRVGNAEKPTHRGASNYNDLGELVD
jgi:hypothetical protein